MSDYAEKRRIEFELEIGIETEEFINFIESIIDILNSFNNISMVNNAGELYLQKSRRVN